MDRMERGRTSFVSCLLIIYAAPFRMMSFSLMTFYFRTTTGEASTHTNTRAQRSTITMRRAARKAVSRENIDSLRK